ncbi:MAG: T9SS type A sorting domain-containing protein [Bacteroidota bacterium]
MAEIVCNRVYNGSIRGIYTFLGTADAYIAENEVFNIFNSIGIRAYQYNSGDVVIENNIVSECGIGIGETTVGSSPTCLIRNNIVFDNGIGLSFWGDGGSEVEMNVVYGNDIGLNQYEASSGTPSEVSYNLLYDNQEDFSSAFNLAFGGQLITVNGNGDSTDAYFNLFRDPLIDSNYVPQVGSPLVNAGNPAQVDPDGSMRNIGLSLDPNASCLVAAPPALPRTPVYPGDANGDSIADVWDLLSIGVHQGRTGPARDSVSTVWAPQPALDWGTSQASGVDLKHADCDGNGIIEMIDAQAIAQNYQWMPRQGVPANGQAQLSIDVPVSALPGDTLTVSLRLNQPNGEVEDVYGLALSIAYDEAYINPDAAIAFDVQNSWLGADGNNLMSMHHVEQGRVDLSIVRTEQIAISGEGIVAELRFVIVDSLPLGSTAHLMFDIQAADVIHNDESLIPTSWVGGSTRVDQVVTPTSILDAASSSVKVFPNPATDRFTVQWEQTHEGGELMLVDLTGRTQLAQNVTPNQMELQLEVSTLPSGFYWLRMPVGKGENRALLIQIE